MPTILVIGSINMDQVMTLPHWPEVGESIIGTTLSYSPGGKGANAAIAAARLGASVRFAGCVGKDDFGQALRRTLEDEGISTSLLRASGEAATGLAPILVSAGGENIVIVYPGANMLLRQEDLPAMFQGQIDALMMQLEIPQPVILAASRMAAQKGIPVVLDAGPAQRFPVEEMEGLFILSPNETECTALSGLPVGSLDETRLAARSLFERTKARYVVVKMGARGAYIYGEGIDRHLPAFTVKAVDPTAAGDAFTGAMTIEYLRCGDIERAVRYGCAAGAIAATKLGAQPSLPSAQAVEAFLRG
ncbi:MAG: ribokinase [Christensenellaceae bacterium]|jgi:ribokinase|nr:ribokinase [Christensenellaceae bacterium]